MPYAFDSVEIDRDEGSARCTAEEFLRLPLNERAKLVMARRVRFFAGPDAVDRQVALKSMREVSADGAPGAAGIRRR